MGFRFRKSIKLFPGFKINLTHKGISSASIGKPGASVNIGKKGTRTSVGIPGTGCLTPSIDLTRRKRIPNNRQLSNNPSSHPLRRRNQNQSSGFGSLLGWFVLLLGQ